MASRWTRFLPGWPAVLLIPTVLWLWVMLCAIPQDPPAGVEFVTDQEGDYVSKGVHGYPFTFFGDKQKRSSLLRTSGFLVIPFVADLVIALGAAYLLALGLDRVVIRRIRTARMKKYGERAFLSVRSLLVMCTVLAAFAWLNLRERLDVKETSGVNADGSPFRLETESRYRGFPWTCRTERDPLAWSNMTIPSLTRSLRSPGDSVFRIDSELRPFIFLEVEVVPLLLNVVVALLASLALALATERFVFSKLRRRAPPGEAAVPARPPDSGT